MPELLRERNFRRFWFGQTISMFGDQVTGVALPVLAVLSLGAEATQMGLLVAVGLLPPLLFSLPAGVWLDRVRRRRRLMVFEFVSGFGVMILDINGGSMLFARTPDRIRGRVNGAFRFVNMGVRPIGAVIGGILGVRETLLVVTVAQLLGVLWLIGSPIPGLKDLPQPG